MWLQPRIIDGKEVSCLSETCRWLTSGVGGIQAGVTWGGLVHDIGCKDNKGEEWCGPCGDVACTQSLGKKWR